MAEAQNAKLICGSLDSNGPLGQDQRPGPSKMPGSYLYRTCSKDLRVAR